MKSFVIFCSKNSVKPRLIRDAKKLSQFKQKDLQIKEIYVAQFQNYVKKYNQHCKSLVKQTESLSILQSIQKHRQLPPRNKTVEAQKPKNQQFSALKYNQQQWIKFSSEPNLGPPKVTLQYNKAVLSSKEQTTRFKSIDKSEPVKAFLHTFSLQGKGPVANYIAYQAHSLILNSTRFQSQFIGMIYLLSDCHKFNCKSLQVTTGNLFLSKSLADRKTIKDKTLLDYIDLIKFFAQKLKSFQLVFSQQLNKQIQQLARQRICRIK